MQSLVNFAHAVGETITPVLTESAFMEKGAQQRSSASAAAAAATASLPSFIVSVAPWLDASARYYSAGAAWCAAWCAVALLLVAGVMTPDEFVEAGDKLVALCGTWQWCATCLTVPY